MSDDIHSETAKKLFGEVNADTRARAKIIDYAALYGTRVPPRHRRLAECEGAQQNETDGAAEAALASFATLTTVSVCLLSDLHQCLHRGEACPECGYKFEDIG